MMNQNKNNSKKRKTVKKSYSKMVHINGSDIEFVVTDALYAKVLDEEMLLDQVPIDFMIDNLANTFKSSSFPTDKIPKTIVLSMDSYQELWHPSNHFQDEKINPSNLIDFDENIQEKMKDLKPTINSIAEKGEEKNSSDSSLSNKKKPSESIDETLQKASKKDDFLKVYQPRYTFDDVYVDPIFKRRIVSSLILAKQKKKIYEEWGLLKTLKNPRPLVLNFYGPPGTGKSMMAEAIAHYLQTNVFLVNYSELESGSPGETPRNIVRCFQRAKESNAVLIFDEADSFLGKRLTNVSSAADNTINVTRSVMLIELEKFDGVIVFTTNFISNYDIAFKRRILASMEFKLPDEKGRAHIWRTHIPKELPLSTGISPLALAYKYGGTTGADIKDIVLFAAVNCLEKGRERISWEDFDEAYQAVKNRYNVV